MTKDQIFTMMSCLAGVYNDVLFGTNSGAGPTEEQIKADAKRARKRAKRKP